MWKYELIQEGLHIFKDGDMWCAVGPHFIDLNSSNAGFGSDPWKAFAELRDKSEKNNFWKDKIFPSFNDFKVWFR